jgi:hypothetical protein
LVKVQKESYDSFGKDPVPNVKEAGWAPGPVWMGRKIHCMGKTYKSFPVITNFIKLVLYPGRVPLHYQNLLTKAHVKGQE